MVQPESFASKIKLLVDFMVNKTTVKTETLKKTSKQIKVNFPCPRTGNEYY